MDTATRQLQPHQERVVNEEKELDDKVQKLSKFLDTEVFTRLDTAEQNRLECQLRHMNSYLEVLRERIAAF